jgi:C-terminal processing protease CtpA/Prc
MGTSPGPRPVISPPVSDVTVRHQHPQPLKGPPVSNRSRRRALTVFLSLVLFSPILVPGSAAVGDEPTGPPLTAATRAATIEGVLKRLREGYVFPEVAQKMEQGVRERARKGAYDGITRGEDLARDLTAHLREVGRDSHILVTYSREKRPKRPANDPTADEQEKRKRRAASVNFGFKRVERLAGNVGYLELEGFWRPAEAAETAVAAMTFLTNTDALVIDLRSNGGGNPGTVALLCSYFLGEEPVHLWDEHSRPGAVTRPVWSLPHISGKRYLGKDVFLLTSRGTYSAAEGFAYTLKNLKRATVVGEATGGGAHPGDTQYVDEHFSMFVPTGRIVSPITKTDWEGTGVQPDVEVPARLALATAHLEALKRVAARRKDDPEAAGQLAKIRQGVERELNDLKANGTK